MNSQRAIKIKLLVIQLIAIIPLLLFIFYIFDMWFDTRRSIALDNSINQARLIANTVEETFKLGVNISAILATSPSFKARLNEKSNLLEGTLKTITANIEEINAVMISDAAGKIIGHSDTLTPQQERDITIADRDYFQELLAKAS